MATDDIDYESLTVMEIMVLRELRNRALDFPDEIRPPIPSMDEIDAVLDGAGGGLDNAIGYLWDTIRDFVYDNFPKFRIDDYEDEEED